MMRGYTTAIVINDVHIPFQDDAALRIVEDFIKRFKPTYLIIDGDFVDMWEVSKFDKDPREGLPLEDELKQAIDELTYLRDFAKHCIYVFGNHEIRFQSYILRNARHLVGLNGLNLADQLDLKRMKIDVIHPVGKEAVYQFGDVLIGHFNKANKHSAYTAKNLLEEKGMSLIQAHTHRGGVHYKTTYNGDVLTAIENFCLCDLHPTYVNHPNWQQGISIIHKKGDKCYIQQLAIRDGGLFYGNELF